MTNGAEGTLANPSIPSQSVPDGPDSDDEDMEDMDEDSFYEDE